MTPVTDPNILAQLNGQTSQQQQSLQSQPGQQPFNGVDPAKLLGLYSKINPQMAQELIGKMIQQRAMPQGQTNPLQQSEILRNLAQANRYSQPQDQMKQAQGPAAYVNDSGDVSDVPKDGYRPVSKQILPYVGVSKSSKEKNSSLNSRSEAIQRGIDARQIDRLAQTVGLTQQQRNLMQKNNMQSNRVIQIASQGPITWQEFGAMTSDFTSMIHGGVPGVDELHDMAYPSWKQDISRIRTFALSQPTANVPEEFKNRVLNDIKGVQQVDNRYLTKNAEFMQKMLSPTIRGGIGQFQGPISDMTNTITGTASSGNTDMSKMSDDELRKIASGQ